MATFIRKHLFLVLGVSLPLVLVLFVFIAQMASRQGVAPPATPVLFLFGPHFSTSEFVRWTLVDQRLTLSLSIPESTRPPPSADDQPVTVALYDPRLDSLELIKLTLPKPLKAGMRVDMAVPARLQALRLSGAPESPDGYRLEYRLRRSGGLIGGLLGLGGRGSGYQLTRDGVSYPLPATADGAYRIETFIGWVIDDEHAN